MKNNILMVSVATILCISGCTVNRYKISTVYANPADETQIMSEIEGKATIGKVASIYERVLEFVNKSYGAKGK